MYDIILRNARIIDGTGSAWYHGDIGIQDGKIKSIGALAAEAAAQEYDVHDLYVAPGFIDIHTHSDKSLGQCRLAGSRILQGVTTEIGGNCGMSAFPVSEKYRSDLDIYMAADLPYTWTDAEGFFRYLESAGISTNFGCLVGHGSLRIAVMGMAPDAPTEEQLDEMYRLAKSALQQGAFGISSGLIYPPGSYSEKEEMISLLRAVKECGGYYATHMRNESRDLIKSVKESIEVCEAAGVPLQISHHKCVHKPLWRKAVLETTAMMEAAQKQGLDVTCDQYPYNASSTVLSSNIPGWGFEGGFDRLLERLHDPETRQKLKIEADESHVGRWQNILVANPASEKNRWMVGKNLVELGEILGKSPADVVFDLVEEERNLVDEVNFGMDEDDIEYIMKKPYIMPGSDGEAMSLDAAGRPHPRNYGTFPRVLAHYCRDRKLFPLEEAVRKMTSLPASRLGLTDRGVVKEGAAADLVVFDCRKLQSNPDYENPAQPCDGIKYVFVNGVLTAENGKHTGAKAGKILRRK